MKTIFKIPVLLLALMLVVSCGDSKKEEEEKAPTAAEILEKDIKRACELECISKLESFDHSSDEGKAAFEEWEAIYEKYEGDESEASDEIKMAWKNKKVNGECSCASKD